MPDPYNITQVDVPGVIGAVHAAQTNRLQQLLLNQQIQAQQRQADREVNLMGVFSRMYGGNGASPTGAAKAAASYGGTPATVAPSAGPVSPAAVTASSVPDAYGVSPSAGAPSIGANAVPPVSSPGVAPAAPSPAAAPAPAAAQAPAQGMRRLSAQDQQAILQADPIHGGELIHQMNAMSDEQLASAQHRAAALAPLLINASRIPLGTGPDPLAARRAYIQSVMPQLQQMGIDPAQANGFEPTDANLSAHYALGQTVQEAADRFMTSEGQVFDKYALPAGTAANPVVAETTLVRGANGQMYNRAELMAQTPPRPGEVRQTSRGPMRFMGGDSRDPANYQPVEQGAPSATPDLDNWNRGGAPQPQAAGTFR